MQRTISATEARIHLGDVLRRVVENHETVVIARSGKPQAVVLSMAEYERLRDGPGAERSWWALVERARERIQQELAGRPLPPAEDVIRQMREERDEQLLDLR